MSEYGWIITRDHLADAESNEAGIIGPSDISDEMATQLKNGEGTPFRMLDDDGNIYYDGLVVGDITDGGDPLTDFGMPNAGCVLYQEYQNGEWVDVIG